MHVSYIQTRHQIYINSRVVHDLLKYKLIQSVAYFYATYFEHNCISGIMSAEYINFLSKNHLPTCFFCTSTCPSMQFVMFS